MVLDFLAVDKFDFTRKIAKKNFSEKLVKMWSFVKIDFFDKNLTFRIVVTILRAKRALFTFNFRAKNRHFCIDTISANFGAKIQTRHFLSFFQTPCLDSGHSFHGLLWFSLFSRRDAPR